MKQVKRRATNLSGTEISDMPDGEFEATISLLVAGLQKRMEDSREPLTTGMKELKNQSEMKNAVTDNRNGPNALRAGEAEE